MARTYVSSGLEVPTSLTHQQHFSNVDCVPRNDNLSSFWFLFCNVLPVSTYCILYSPFPPYEHGTRRAPWLEGLSSAILQELWLCRAYRPDKAQQTIGEQSD